MNDQFIQLLKKYVLISICFYLGEYLFSMISYEYGFSEALNNRLLRLQLSTLITLSFNSITAYLISKDIEAIGVKTKYVILATVLFRSLGICAFLLYVLHESKRQHQGDAFKNL